MSSVSRFWLLFGLLALGIGFAQSQGPQSPAPNSPAPRGGPPAQTIGMAGCAATGCHGRPNVRHGTRDADTWHESLALWIDRDPHTRAYGVLNGALAKKIMEKLGKHDPSVPKDATRDARCMACHSNPSLATDDAMADERLDRIRAEGVSCEACHGNAEHWQIAHTEAIPRDGRTALLKEWQMNDLNDLAVQAKTCAGCHIGAPEDKARGLPVRDMNHDMIAAGHPRLEFDFAAFQSKIPSHWQPKHRGPGAGPGQDAALHAWVLGQIATEDAYCELSLDRIARANTQRSPYPEFADWNCSQCHHNLAPAAWREAAAKSQTGTGGLRELGRPIWIGSSAFAPSTPLAKFGDKIANQKSVLDARRKQLDDERTTIAKDPNAEIRRRIDKFLTDGPGHKLNWEETARAYLGLQSLEASLLSAGGSPSAPFPQLRFALWGSSDVPARKEHAAKDYHRKPENRWIWETKPELRPETVEATIQSIRTALAADLKKLPPPPSKP